MPAAGASNSILAKARAKYGRRLTAKNYRDMIALGSVADLAAYLKAHTHYAAALAGIQESAVHRGNLEKLLQQSDLKDIQQLCHFEQSVGEHVFEYIVMRGEIDQLLRFIRYLAAGRPEEYILDLSYSFNSFTKLDLPALSKLRSFSELAAALKGTRYERIVRFFAADAGRRQLDNVESAFTLFLYQETFQMLHKSFSGETRKELEYLLSLEAELTNIRRVVRSKKYYDANRESLEEHMLPYRCLLTAHQQETMLSAADANEALAVLQNSRYKRFTQRFAPEEIDGFARRVLLEVCQQKLHFSKSPAVVMICFFQYAQGEVDNVTNIIEGIRYGLPPDRISALLTLPEKERG